MLLVLLLQCRACPHRLPASALSLEHREVIKLVCRALLLRSAEIHRCLATSNTAFPFWERRSALPLLLILVPHLICAARKTRASPAISLLTSLFCQPWVP